MIYYDDQHLYKSIKYTVIVSSGVTAFIGIIGLLGWILGLKVLASISASYIPVSISTCIVFIIFSIILLLYVYIHSYINILLLLIPVNVVTLLVTLLSPFGFGNEWTMHSNISPYIMSPLTATLAIVIGVSVSLLLIYRTSKLIISMISVLAIIVIITSLVIALSYVYTTPLLYGLPIIPMALTTSIGFICLGIGLIAVTGQSGLLSYLAGSSVRAMLLRTFVPLGFIGVIGSDIFQHQFTKLNSAIVSGGSLVFFGVATVVVVIQAARVIGGIVESADAKRKQAEEMVRRDKEEWENTFNTVPDLIAILDCQHNVVRVNRAMAERLGLPPEQCVGAKCHEVVHGAQEPPGFCPHTLTCKDGQEHLFEVHEPHLGGDFIVSTTPKFDDQGQVIGTVHVARDITERKQAEEEREKLISELQDALAKVKLLSGFLPICASCKKIRNDKGYWQQIEAYIHDHSEAQFSHGICPDCAKKLYPELFDKTYPESSDE